METKTCKCAKETCEAIVMDGRGYCLFHGGQIQYKKDMKSGKIKKPAPIVVPAPVQPQPEPPSAPVNPYGQTDIERYRDVRKLQKRGLPGHGLGGLSKLDRERNHFSK
ncbi:MAG: hypothetical protein V1928_04965 [Parcubacteria group bacterium]